MQEAEGEERPGGKQGQGKEETAREHTTGGGGKEEREVFKVSEGGINKE